VCHACFDTSRWWCNSCSQVTSTVKRGPQVSAAGLFFLAFVLIFVGIMTMSLAPILSGGGVGSVGTVILIGPIPIVLGSGPLGGVMVVLALVLTIIAVILGVVLLRWRR